MRWLLILLVIIAIAAIIWYMRQSSERAAAERRRDEQQRLQAATPAARPSLPAAAPVAKAEGLLEHAAETASGVEYERATEEMERLTAELEAARTEADRTAARIEQQAREAMAVIQEAAAAHGGAVPGDGTRDCPAGYPVKGKLATHVYHEAGHRGYALTIPDVCFQGVAAAEASGFSPPTSESGEEVVVAEAVVVEADTHGDDVVAAAIAAADAGGVPPGAIRGDGSRDCPPAYPIKGNAQSRRYHLPTSPNYGATIPELCFASEASATAAGFRTG